MAIAKKFKRIGIVLAAVTVSTAVLISCTSVSGLEGMIMTTGENKQHIDGDKFVNTQTDYKPDFTTGLTIMKRFITEKRNAPLPLAPIPVHELSNEKLTLQTEDMVYRLGHSSLLLKLSGQYVLIDPIFSERASPVQWIGPKRFHQPPLTPEQLPHLSSVVISHDHYDHLDEASIKALADKTDFFVTPLRVGERIIDWGIPREKVVQLDWWQSTVHQGIELVATPAQHFSGRGVFDSNKTLWASWVIRTDKTNVFYTGDTGYFSGFKEIGDKYGPFDITMVETGAYNELWAEIHMSPEQSVQTHIDLKGKAMLPVHNGTFDLALHDWYEPFERCVELAADRQIQLLTPEFGQGVRIKEPVADGYWWRNVLAAENDVLVASAGGE